jgi:hypothetical protein
MSLTVILYFQTDKREWEEAGNLQRGGRNLS